MNEGTHWGQGYNQPTKGCSAEERPKKRLLTFIYLLKQCWHLYSVLFNNFWPDCTAMSAKAHVVVHAKYPILFFDSKGNLYVPKTCSKLHETHRVIKYVMMCDGYCFMLATNLCTWVPVCVTKQRMAFHKSQDYVIKQTRA
jgi:hypothetical protein